jgi:glycosyltransferase involved in cell wall biosynthesis
MKIAIVTSHPVPFALGGAENLWWGLQSYIEQETPHRCDVISLVTPEATLDGLVNSYRAFSELDLSDYDCVISGKYPAWMVQHPNHVCYMLHRLRGLYDTYRGPGAEAISSGRARALADWMHDMAGDHASRDQLLPAFFERYENLRNSDVAGDVFAFPGPLAREIVRFLDRIGLSPDSIQRFGAISQTVAGRNGYFPLQAAVSVLHPPPHRDDYRCGGQSYFFTSSRLDRPKRLDLIIEAMRFVRADIPLLIAGAGPDETRLRALAEGDPRIRFLGFVPDRAMPGFYADALAVPFVPYDEDYGLITVEAMRSGKPVVTVADAGGPTEFVRNGETGFVTTAEPEALGERLSYLADHRDHAREMGETARAAVQNITWAAVFNGLMQRPVSKAEVTRRARPKLTVATTFPIYPPMGGGQARVFNLYREMAATYDIDVVSMHDVAARPREIAPGLVEIRVAKSLRQLHYEQAISEAVGRQPVGDMAAALAGGLTSDYLEALANSCATAEAGIACHPYLIDALRGALGTRPLWYEAQDVELDLKRSILSAHPGHERLLETVRETECKAWRLASHVFACAERDLHRLGALYGPTRAVLHEVPNGVALQDLLYTEPAKRRALQERLGVAASPIALFMGSWHQPNIEAVEDILSAAPRLPNLRFVVLGSVCGPFKDRALPGNVDLLGPVTTQRRDDLLAAAHVALNPMRSGSGTNLKMLDYFAAGIPVVSSRIGARGLAAEAGQHFIGYNEAVPEGLVGALDLFASTDRARLDEMVGASRALVEARYSWEIIARNFLDELRTGKSAAA